jgi:hypothetical protein
VARGSAGEGAFFVPEQLRFDQLGGHSGAIESHERAGMARAFLMDRSRDQFLARAGLALNCDAGFAGRDAFHLRHEPLHDGAGPDHFVLAEGAAQIAIFVLEMAQAQDVFDRDEEFFRRERLFQKIHGAEARGAHRRFHIRLARNHHHWRRHSGRF